MTLIIALSILVLTVSFLCSMLEAVLLSVTPAYVALLVKDGKRSGKLLERLKENIDRPISAILTLNTVSHTLGAAAIGALVHEYYGNTAVTIASVLLTILILVLSEILPKIIGVSYWKELSTFSAYGVQLLIFVMYPVVRLSEILGGIFKKSDDEAAVTREEIITTAEIGVEEGSLQKKESTIIKNLLMLDNIYVSDIMTPRSVVFALDSQMTVEEVAQQHKPIRFSRIPVYNDNLDHIVGLTHRYKILEALSSDHHDKKISELMTNITTVSERMTVAALIDYFIKQKEHLSLAIDEYGVITGLVSLEDAIETLLGVEIVDEFDHIADMRQYALEQWQQRKAQIKRI